MTESEKVICGLKHHLLIHDGEECVGCPYSDFELLECERQLYRDAMGLLKEQEPRVLTLDEVEDALDTVVWVERPGDENWSDGFGLIVMYSHKNGWVRIQCQFGEDPSEDNYDYSDYGKGWRCWSARPTDEQRKEVKWDD